jgi:hypothetical protein
MPTPIAAVAALGIIGGVIALAAATSKSRQVPGTGSGNPPPDTCEKLLQNLPADIAAMIGAAKSVADMQNVANVIEARIGKPAADCLRAQIAAGILNSTAGGAGPLGGTPVGFTPADCTFSDIPDTAATPPGFPTPIAPGMGSLRVAARNSFIAMKSSKNGAGLMVIGQTLNAMGYSNSAACVIQWATIFGGVPSSPPIGGTPVGTSGSTLHDLFDQAIKSGGLSGTGAPGPIFPTSDAPSGGGTGVGAPPSGQPAIAVPTAPAPHPATTEWDFGAFGLSAAMG